MSSCVFIASSSKTAKRPEYICPALLTRMATPPSFCLAVSIIFAMSDSLVMSATTAWTSPPVFLANSSRACSSFFWLRPVISTRTPSSRNWRAVSKPMPLLPPVTIARRPLIPRSIVYSPVDAFRLNIEYPSQFRCKKKRGLWCNWACTAKSRLLPAPRVASGRPWPRRCWRKVARLQFVVAMQRSLRPRFRNYPLRVPCSVCRRTSRMRTP